MSVERCSDCCQQFDTDDGDVGIVDGGEFVCFGCNDKRDDPHADDAHNDPRRGQARDLNRGR